MTKSITDRLVGRADSLDESQKCMICFEFPTNEYRGVRHCSCVTEQEIDEELCPDDSEDLSKIKLKSFDDPMTFTIYEHSDVRSRLQSSNSNLTDLQKKLLVQSVNLTDNIIRQISMQAFDFPIVYFERHRLVLLRALKRYQRRLNAK